MITDPDDTHTLHAMRDRYSVSPDGYCKTRRVVPIGSVELMRARWTRISTFYRAHDVDLVRDDIGMSRLRAICRQKGIPEPQGVQE